MSSSRSQQRYRPSISFPAEPYPTLEYASPEVSPRVSLLRREILPLWVVVLGGFAFGVVVLAMPKFSCGCRGSVQARVAAAKTDITSREMALDAFRADMGRYPKTAEGLGALVLPPGDAADAWHGPYIKGVPNDPWGSAYIYQFPGTHNSSAFDLHSFGPDRRDGGDDITNWTTP
jgi:general secretion pathway protein G